MHLPEMESLKRIQANLRILAISLFILPAFLGQSAIAQQPFGSIRGNITDTYKHNLTGVVVTVNGSALIGGSVSKICRDNGSYEFVGLLPGTYEIKVNRDGYQTILREGIRVFAGSVILLDFSLEPDLAQAVTVIGNSLLIDSGTTATSHVVPVEMIDALPKPDSITTILTWTSGVGDDHVAYGSAAGNRFWLDGVDVSSPAGGILYAQYDPSWFEEAQVTGIGMPAEFGGFSGVIGNFVTRSGGNQFHGLFETFFQNENFVSSNRPDSAPDTSFHTYDVSAQIGGPIVQDQLWFFSGIQYPYTQTRPFDYDGVTTEKYPRVITKLTYKPNANNTVQGFVHYNSYELDGAGAGSFTLPEATSIESCSESTWNATWISLLSDETTFEGKFGGLWADCKGEPRNGDIPGHFDFSTGSSVNAASTWTAERFRPQINATLSHYGDDFLGVHDFKFGVQLERSHVLSQESFNGGYFYYDYGGPFLRISLLDDSGFDISIRKIAAFIHDSWNLNDRMTLSLGLRWDHNRGITDRGTVFASDPVAPRIGFIYKPLSGENTVIKFHYGDYYDALLSLLFDRLTDVAQGDRTEQFNPATGQWELIEVVQRLYSADPELKQPFHREFTLGIDQKMPGELGLGIHYVRRKWHNILEDINLTDEYEPIQIVNPLTDELLTIYNRVVQGDSPRFLTNPDGLFRSYDGLEITATRRFIDRLSLSCSFFYSRIRGNIPNTADAVLDPFSDFLNDPNHEVNFIGNLVNDPTFAWKIVAAYEFPWGFQTGMFLRHESGDTWTPQWRVRTVNQRPRSVINLEPLGSRRLSSTTLMDLRIEKTFGIRDDRLHFTADIFNVFNTAAVTAVQNQVDASDFGEPVAFTGPRQIRLGLRYTF